VQFRKELTERMQHLQMDASFATRALNEGFSGGEKKRAEMLQLAMLKPRVAVLDEPDSGLDIDAVRIVSDGINSVHQQQPEMGVLLITHYQRILNYVLPDKVHVMATGRIVESGGRELVQQLESEGYDPILRRLGVDGAEGGDTSNGR
jgi:Fe-S cluster assembly ATP-binding protein